MELKDKLFLVGIVVVFIAIICAMALGVMVIWNVTLGLMLPDMSYGFSFILTLVAVVGGIWYWLSGVDPEGDPYASELERYSYPEYDEEPEESYNEVLPSEEEKPVEKEQPKEVEEAQEPVVEKPKRKTTRRKKVNKEKETE